MTPNHPFAFLSDLEMPLRDVARGLASVGGVTKKVLKPAADLLPDALRVGLEQAAHSIDGVGTSLINMPITLQDVGLAADFAAGTAHDKPARMAFTKVLSYGWQHLLGDRGEDGLILSETILATQLMTAKAPAPTTATGTGTAPDHAAALLRDILASHSIGRPPGLPLSLPADEKDEVALLLVAIMVWALSERAASMAQEAEVLDLSLALILASRADVLHALHSPDQLGRILATASAHL